MLSEGVMMTIHLKNLKKYLLTMNNLPQLLTPGVLEGHFSLGQT